jgi:lipoate-protein ligase A
MDTIQPIGQRVIDEWRVMAPDWGQPASTQMALDERLAREATPTVRLFLWDPPAVSLGRKQPCPEWLTTQRWRAAELELVERPTGGGVAFHGSDVSISAIVPLALRWPLETLMTLVCQSAAMLCESFGVQATCVLHPVPPGRPWYGEGRMTCCLTETAPYAVLIGKRKVAGFAARRYPQSWLIQGSLLVQPLPGVLRQALPADVMDALKARATPLSKATMTPVREPGVAQRWTDHWPSWWNALSRVELAEQV